MDITYQLKRSSLAKAFQLWIDEYNENPEGFTIYREGETEGYGLAATRALIDYVNEVEKEITINIAGE